MGLQRFRRLPRRPIFSSSPFNTIRYRALAESSSCLNQLADIALTERPMHPELQHQGEFSPHRDMAQRCEAVGFAVRIEACVAPGEASL